MPTTQLK